MDQRRIQCQSGQHESNTELAGRICRSVQTAAGSGRHARSGGTFRSGARGDSPSGADPVSGARIAAVGESMLEAAQRIASPAIVSFPDSLAAAEEVRSMAKPGDIVFLKASRGTRLERIEPARNRLRSGKIKTETIMRRLANTLPRCIRRRCAAGKIFRLPVFPRFQNCWKDFLSARSGGRKPMDGQFIGRRWSAAPLPLFRTIRILRCRKLFRILSVRTPITRGNSLSDLCGFPAPDFVFTPSRGPTGKTTTAFLLRRLIQETGQGRCGLISTIEYDFGGGSRLRNPPEPHRMPWRFSAS